MQSANASAFNHLRIIRHWALISIVFFSLLFLAPLGLSVAAHYSASDANTPWSRLRRDSSQQAPDPAKTRDAVIQVYAARAARWRGAFAVHTWITTKKADADFYNRLEVIGYGVRWTGHSVRVSTGRPDSYWYGSKPWLLRELRGKQAIDTLIDQLHAAASRYPMDGVYAVWPGPNSNTFIAWLSRQVPQLQLELPVTAIGKDYFPGGQMLSKPASGKGFQFSILGLAGLIVSPEEGVEINILGLSLGADLNPLAIKLPGIGRVGLSDFKRLTG